MEMLKKMKNWTWSHNVKDIENKNKKVEFFKTFKIPRKYIISHESQRKEAWDSLILFLAL
jgi:hypothetical protein